MSFQKNGFFFPTPSVVAEQCVARQDMNFFNSNTYRNETDTLGPGSPKKDRKSSHPRNPEFNVSSSVSLVSLLCSPWHTSGPSKSLKLLNNQWKPAKLSFNVPGGIILQTDRKICQGGGKLRAENRKI